MSSSENTPANILKGEACETDEEDKGTDEADVEEVSSVSIMNILITAIP